MGGSVLADADRVVREDVDRRDLHERAQADGGPGVIAEDQEAGAEAADLRERQSVHHRPHRVLPNAEVHVAAAGILGGQVPRALADEAGLLGGGPGGGAAPGAAAGSSPAMCSTPR